MTRPYRLMVAPNGARRTKADHSALPLTPQELARTARNCFNAGAGAIHLHVRDDEGRHSLDPDRYRDAMNAIAETAPEMAIQITTESAGIYDVAAQLACLETLRPAAASIAVREMARDPDLAAKVYAVAEEAGTVVQHILYSESCIEQMRHWQNTGVVRPRQQDVICVLGSYTPARDAHASDLTKFAPVTAAAGWMACAFGASEHACLLDVLRLGGDVRIGFENSLGSPDTPHASNAASIAGFVGAAQQLGFEPATSSQYQPHDSKHSSLATGE